jgi:hypothetical protein
VISSPDGHSPRDLCGQLATWLPGAALLAEKLHIRAIGDELQRISDRLEQPGFRLVVVGDTGRGKSTFLNLLLGRSCQLPTGATPTTATVTTLRAGRPEQMCVIFPGGREEIRPPGPQSWQDVIIGSQGQLWPGEPPHILLTLDNQWLQDLDIEILDTPGLNGPERRNARTELIAHLLSECDAVALVINARYPLSLTEKAFLERIIKEHYIPRVLLVVSIRPEDFTRDDLVRQMRVIQRRVAKIDPHISIVPTAPVLEGEDEATVVATLRAEIGALAIRSERKNWRSRRCAALLAAHLEQIIRIGTAGEAGLQLSQQQREETLACLDAEIRQELQGWDHLLQEFLRRTLVLANAIQENVWETQRDLWITASLQLWQAGDGKGWWENTFPVLALKALQTLGQRAEKLLVDTLIRDTAWLEAEIAQRFHREHILTPVLYGSPNTLGLGQQEVQLTSTELYKSLLKMLPGVASLLAEIALRYFGLTAGVPGLTLEGRGDASTVEIAVNALWDKKIQQQRHIIDQAMKKSIQQSLDEYMARVVTRLNDIYARIAHDIHLQQVVWKQARYAEIEQKEKTRIHERQRWIREATALRNEVVALLSQKEKEIL